MTPFVSGSLEQRCRPLSLYPGARTVIALAYPWYFPDPAPWKPGQGIIAMSARGEDYHRVLRRRLEPLVSWLREQGARLVVTQVDNGPLLEREAAFWAGLGYYGYNCSLIVPGWGSWVALGLIVTDLEIEPTPYQEERRCKECGQCFAACPSGALIGPYILNPSRCLSYLTQKRGFLPREVRSLLGARLYGCDTCQEVCPENEGLSREQAQLAKPFPFPDLVNVLQLDNHSFKEQFGATALAWRGKGVLKRNALIALGNSGYATEEAIKIMEQFLSSPSAILRAHAAWALGQLKVPHSHLALEMALQKEQDPMVRQELEKALFSY